MAAGFDFCSRAEKKCRIFSSFLSRACKQNFCFPFLLAVFSETQSIRECWVLCSWLGAAVPVCGWPGLWYLSPARGSGGNAGVWLAVRWLTGREESYRAAEVVVAPSNALKRLAGHSGLTQPCDTAPGPFPLSHRFVHRILVEVLRGEH